MQNSAQTKKIVILTTGQPSTNPRMIKEYAALKEEGYAIKVYYSYWQKWAFKSDETLFESGGLDKKDFMMVGGSPFLQRMIYLQSRIFQKVNAFIYYRTGFKSEAAISRTTSHLIKAAKKEKADLYIAHNPGALPAAVAGASKYRTKAGFDAEDYHRGEYKDLNSKAAKHLIAVENRYIPQCSYLTAAAPLIAKAYQNLYSLKPVNVIHNVFSSKHLQSKLFVATEALSLFWFSQTIGPHRGLEAVVKALALLKDRCSIELHLMGTISAGFDTQLLQLIGNNNNLHFYAPVPPNEVFGIAARYDIGLSIEVPYFENRDICLTNKIFTYLLAANCIIYSDTKAQQNFHHLFPATGYLFPSNNEKALAELLEQLYNDREKVFAARQASRTIAADQLNWETEGKKFRKLISNQFAT